MAEAMATNEKRIFVCGFFVGLEVGLIWLLSWSI